MAEDVRAARAAADARDGAGATPDRRDPASESLRVPVLTPPVASRRGYLAAKRALDVIGSLAGILLCLPIWAILVILIKLESPGPVLFSQTRVGENGRVFRFLKLRSMYVDADQRRAAFEELNEMSGPVFKIRDDPRVTRVGRFLRRYSLDETPQLMHVLLGQMTLVGPRPPLLEEVERYEPWQTERLSIRPGLTCIWQVSGRNEIPFDRWVQMDIYYVRHRTFWMDLWLLVQTVPAVLMARGAY